MLRLIALTLPLAACTALPGSSSEEPRLEDVFEQVQTAVVTVYTAGRTGLRSETGQAVTAEGVGSGTLIEGGHVLTASHVVQTADQVAVAFADGSLVEARVQRSIPSLDLALLKLLSPAPKGAKPVPLGDSSAVRVAERVFVVGAPLGVSHTLTVGHLSARRVGPSLVGSGGEVEVLQTDAAINHGNSGGPMFNLRGEVVGVVSFILSESGSSAGLGFAVSSKTVREHLLDRPAFWGGVDWVMLEGEWSKAFNLPDGRPGLLVQRVARGSAGAVLGLKGSSIPIEVDEQPLLIGGDVILTIAGIEIGSSEATRTIGEKIDAMADDATLEVVVLRDGRERTLSASMGKLRGDG